ncbi:MAG: hypothetical protein SGILL_004236 [Bacillariaceae sp.]
MPSSFRRSRNEEGRRDGQQQQLRQDDDGTFTTEPQPGPEFDQQVEALIPAQVRMISGCHTLETSADISNIQSVTTPQGKLPSPAGRSGGACTSALLSILYDPKHKAISFQQLLLELRSRLSQAGMSQIPQLSGSRPFDLKETPFSLVNQQPEFLQGTSTGGTRRALLVGINYVGQNGQLSGCINDVMNVKKYLCEQQGYLFDDIVVLVDDGQHCYPTRQKIIRALRQLVAQSVPGDSVYFHYSGHGGLLDPDYWNRFKVGNLGKQYDETLYPVDHDRAGQIRDFSLFNHFVKPMPAGVTVTCVMDCCHSGSVLDLPYTYQPTSAGTIRMRQSMDALSNLAFLYIVAGGMLPYHGGLFDSVTQNLQDVTGDTVDNLTGTAVEEMTFDNEAFADEAYGGVDGFGSGGDAAQLDGYDGHDFDNGGVEGGDMYGAGYGGFDNDADGMYDRVVDDSGGQDDGGAFFNNDNFGYQGADTSAGDGFDCGDGGGADVDCGDCDVADIISSILEEL